jgi:transcriptional regulator GlxA family with amidase domain
MMKVAVLLFDGVEELDFAGPFEVFGHVAEVFTVAPSYEVKGRHGLKVTADYTFENAPQSDVLVVPGGPVARENPAALVAVAEYVKAQYSTCRLLLSVCTGAFILAAAGLLEGRSCTTHHRRRHLLLARHPQVQIRYARVVSDGKIITTAGVAAGIDGALHAVSRLFDMEQARKVARQIEHPWHSSHVVVASQQAEPYYFWEESGQALAW